MALPFPPGSRWPIWKLTTARKNLVTFSIGPHRGSMLLDKGATAGDLAAAFRGQGIPAEWMQVDGNVLMFICGGLCTISITEAAHDEDAHRIRN